MKEDFKNYKPSHFLVNDGKHTLLAKLVDSLKHAQYFDVLTGYFRLSGFNALSESIASTEKTRILVGLGADKETITAAVAASTPELDLYSEYRAVKKYTEAVKQEVAASPDEPQVEKGIRRMIQLLKEGVTNSEQDKENGGNGKLLEIRVYPSHSLHAKVYILRYPNQATKGCVITGSSNVSQSGLQDNLEFNVLLAQEDDLNYALFRFEELWKAGIDVREALIDTLEKETWLRNDINPYQLYLKTLYHYFEEDINADTDTDEFYTPDNFLRLDYQLQAARDAIGKLEAFGGVFIADVVGLGKTYITALVLQQLKGRALVVCPPVLKDNWEDALFDFKVSGSRVESLGMLDAVLKKGVDRYEYVVVDEAHRFRNEGTNMYDQLHKICKGKKVILVGATPINNRINDIRSQLFLFQSPRKSNIPRVPNLESFFALLTKRIAEASKELAVARESGSLQDIPLREAALRRVTQQVAEEVKDKILQHLMVRRTRTDIVKHYKKDLKQQGLSFPRVQDPERLVYTFQGPIEDAFIQTIELLKQYQYSRYIPKLFLKKGDLTTFEKAAQRNIGGFMKGLLVKRLESSFYAFRKSLDRFIESAERFLEMFRSGTVYIGKDVRIFEALDNEDYELLEKWLADEELEKYKATDFEPAYIKKLEKDIDTLRKIRSSWNGIDADPKLDTFLEELRSHTYLKGQRLVVFTESKETGDYLFNALNAAFPGQVLFYFSGGGIQGAQPIHLNKRDAQQLIIDNYDPRVRHPDNDIQILIATDVLAEGVNLHRSNLIINYDLPWNPTRVLQRVGRVNRVGSKHNEVFIFNFFPTTQSDAQIGLEANITRKLQMFHDILGEDAKYLFDTEETGSQELFNKLSARSTYESEEEETTVAYLQEIRRIRDEQPALFQTIKELPPKVRCGFKPAATGATPGLITFFREGRLKRFYKATAQTEPDELTFMQAIQQLQVPPDHPAVVLPEPFYALLAQNKAAFEQRGQEADDPTPAASAQGRGSSYLKHLIPVVREARKLHSAALTAEEDTFLEAVLATLAEGSVAKATQKRLKEKLTPALVQHNLPGLLKLLRKEVPIATAPTTAEPPATHGPKGIILSAALV